MLTNIKDPVRAKTIVTFLTDPLVYKDTFIAQHGPGTTMTPIGSLTLMTDGQGFSLIDPGPNGGHLGTFPSPDAKHDYRLVNMRRNTKGLNSGLGFCLEKDGTLRIHDSELLRIWDDYYWKHNR